MVSSVDGVSEADELAESVEELRIRLEAMKKMMEIQDEEQEIGHRKRKFNCRETILDSSFLGFVFLIVLLLIICVSFHAFVNLYYAVVKKFEPLHDPSEL